MKNLYAILLITQMCLVGTLAHSQKLNAAYIDSLVTSSMELMPQAGVAIAVIQDGKSDPLKRATESHQ